jgi:hypothetical protein
MIGLLSVIGIFISCAVVNIWSGFVLTKLWAWFIVPTFALVPLTLAPAIGVALVVSYLTHQSRPSTKSDKDAAEQFIESVVLGLLYPAIVLFVGWIVSFFMPVAA